MNQIFVGLGGLIVLAVIGAGVRLRQDANPRPSSYLYTTRASSVQGEYAAADPVVAKALFEMSETVVSAIHESDVIATSASTSTSRAVRSTKIK